MAENNSPVIKSSDTSEDNQNIFFNVPDKNRMQGPLIQPEAANQVEEEINIETDLPAWQKSLKENSTLIIVCILLVIVLSLGGYLAYYFYFVKSENKPEEVAKVREVTPTPEPIQRNAIVTKTSADWLQKYFQKMECAEESLCGDQADPDRDGLQNLEEFTLGTDPNNPDSDKDGLADGNEVKVFETSPLQASTTGNTKYDDAADAKNGYDSKTPGKKYTDARLSEIKSRMKQYGLHQPTIQTLGESLINLYQFTPDATTSGALPESPPADSALAGVDSSPEAVLDRDTQRSSTIKKLGIALVKFKKASGTYPQTESFTEMAGKVKPYNLVATNSSDPINKEPFIYTYKSLEDGKKFQLTYFSESQKTLIKYTSEQAEKDFNSEDISQRDQQRMQDLETLRSALMTYSVTKMTGDKVFVFPPVSKYKTELSPGFMTSIPKDPVSNLDYDYQVSSTFDSFTLKAVLESPTSGTTGYLCNQEECRRY